MELIQNGGKQIKVWTDIAGIEPEALQQLYRMSRLPFIHDHIAVMPDVHVGKGATVGSVIATKGAIIPAAVGVDIGCFSGDTLITVVDGKNYKIKDLADHGEEIIIFACNTDNKVVAAKANAKLTRKNAKLIKVTLDNDEEINCTPDHKFMLRDGTYIEAEFLSEGQSLMPFYSKKDKEGYTLIKQPYSGSWQRVHWVVARSGLLGEIKSFPDQKIVIHHKNFCESDNRPENLELMGDRDHSSYHRKLVERNTYWQSEDFEKRRIEAIKIKSKFPERHAQLFNHKVKNITHLEQIEDVYCLTVPEYNNFALSAGVFVHNCGMLAAKTNLKSSDLPDSLINLRNGIEQAVPVGRSYHDHDKFGKNLDYNQLSVYQELGNMVLNRSLKQIGTLGGGNHFIEICLDEINNVWIMLHSGSRNIGNEVANIHIKKAKGEMKKALIELEDPDLAYLSEQTQEFKNYVHDLFWCQEYALKNRKVMFENIVNSMKKILPNLEIIGEVTSCHHNYVSIENHFGENVYVTRKGAIKADIGDIGIIPGSMGTKSFIVKGKGHPDSFNSCSHGAGRKMSRTKANKSFTVEDLIEQTKGVECRKDSGVIDEIPGAYKDIDEVNKNQKDLVEVLAVLKQVLCVKG